jgi:hypothetical protein
MQIHCGNERVSVCCARQVKKEIARYCLPGLLDIFTLARYEYIDPSLGEDSIKQRLISHGPLVFGISS